MQTFYVLSPAVRQITLLYLYHLNKTFTATLDSSRTFRRNRGSRENRPCDQDFKASFAPRSIHKEEVGDP